MKKKIRRGPLFKFFLKFAVQISKPRNQSARISFFFQFSFNSEIRFSTTGCPHLNYFLNLFGKKLFWCYFWKFFGDRNCSEDSEDFRRFWRFLKISEDSEDSEILKISEDSEDSEDSDGSVFRVFRNLQNLPKNFKKQLQKTFFPTCFKNFFRCGHPVV